MFTTARLAVLIPFILLFAVNSGGEEPLTLEGALALARERAPAIVAGRLRLEEARARAAKQSRAFTSNPELEATVGRREAADSGETTQDWEVTISQSAGELVRAASRGDAAVSVFDAESRAAEETESALLLEIATSFVDHVALAWRQTSVHESLETAARLHSAAVARFKAGDVAQLDVNLARSLLARAGAEEVSCSEQGWGSRTRLANLLGVEDLSEFVVSMDLTLPPAVSLSDPAATVASRADVRRLDAEIAATRAELRMVAPLRALDWGLFASLAEDDGDRLTSAGLRLGLPFADRGQHARDEATARLARLEHERAALVLASVSELASAANAYHRLHQSASTMTATMLPLLAETDSLALESYDGGQIGIAELAAVRREVFDARSAVIAHWREARLAELRFRYLAGELR